jgi:lipopolysaccharide assembly outer membrane protein LptD (OstA)
LLSILSPARFFSRFLLISSFLLVFGGAINAQIDSTKEAPSSTEISKQLKSQVTYSAEDSMYFDLKEQKIYLYDSASVDYGSIHLRADFIVIDFKNSILTADGKKDSLGNYTEKVYFDDGQQQFEAQQIRYNFVTGKGKVTEVATTQGDGIVQASVIKKDTNGTIYGYKGIFTTCDLEHPHFALRAKKMKFIQDDKIVTGPAYLEIAGIPTPVGVPFGYFPNKKGRKSGILIPTYGESPALGFFLKDGGYYWGISDKIDLALRGDIYSHGSWGAKLFTNYKVRYKYSGNFSTRYSRILTGDRELPDRAVRNDFFITWTHTQDPKANPSIRFAANVNAGTSTYNTFNANRPNDYLANTFQSNVTFAKSWKFGTLSSNLRHSQNNQTGNVDITFPQVALSVNRFYPFRNEKKIGQKWYDKIGISYLADFQNNLNAGDSMIAFRNSEFLKDRLRNGFRQNLPISTSFNVLKYFTLTPAFTINSVTQFKTIRKTWNGTAIEIDTVNGVRANFDWNMSAALSTRLYGMFYMRHTRYSVIRHTMTPTFNFIYMPDFTQPKYGFYDSVQSSTQGAQLKYSIFEGGLYGASVAGKTGAIAINVLNNIEAKKRARENDTISTQERVMLIDAINFGVSYNIMAEHFKWSYITGGLRFRLFKKVDVNAAFAADPYRVIEDPAGLQSDGIRIERFEWRSNNRIARMSSATLNVGTSLRKGGFTSSGNYNSSRGTEQELNMINSNPNAYVDFNIPWSLNVNYTLGWSKPRLFTTVTQNIRFSGDLSVTPKWKIGFDSNYDIQTKQFGYTSLNLYRDLHCWELQFNWVPFGFRQSYNITLNVKSAVLQDLKLTRKRDWYDFSAN